MGMVCGEADWGNSAGKRTGLKGGRAGLNECGCVKRVEYLRRRREGRRRNKCRRDSGRNGNLGGTEMAEMERK